jgi:hypothetical protein
MHLAQFLLMNESVLSGHSFLRYLVKQVEAIKFVTDWQRKGLRAGGKKYKQSVVQNAFDRVPSYDLLHPNGSLEDKKAYQKLFRAFKIKHSKAITARNYLLQLYEQVNISFFLFLLIHLNEYI